MRKLLPLAALLAMSSPAEAVEFHFDGYADFRLVSPSDQVSWVDGGLGKLRYGAESDNPHFRLAEVVGEGVAQITPALMALGVVRYEPEQVTFLDVIEAYARYRPVSTTPFRWSVKAGAFFPPISLENTELGWTSPWTLTPSAINAWVGEELRTVGAEGMVEWRQEARTISAFASIYGWNDPTGILLADRGWALHDRITGLIDKPRLPDVFARQRRQPIPYRTWEFLEIDGSPGWYAGAAWDEAALGHIDVLYYDNEADPMVTRKQVAWRTEFWNLGIRTNIGPVTLLAQGMTGSTYIQPSATFYSDTHFDSAYLLAGWNVGEDWRVAGRFDVFSTDEYHPGTSVLMSEHGNALTFAVTYFPRNWLRLTAEYLRVNSTRTQRTRDGDPAKAVENQFQLSARFYVP
jgi:hypothetical protein